VTDAVIILRDERTEWVHVVAECIREIGLRPVLVTGPVTDADRAALRPAVDALLITADPYDAVGVAATIRRDGMRTAGVVSLSDAVIPVAARVAELLDLRRAPARALALARHKYAARLAMRDAGLPVPRFALLSSADDAETVADEVGLPAVVKPVNGTASHQVSLVHTRQELADAYRRLVDTLPRAPLGGLYRDRIDDGAGGNGLDPARTFLVEGVLRGREYCVDVVVRGGVCERIALIEKFLVDERFFERGFVWPAFDLPAPAQERIGAAVEGAVGALGLDETVAHVEVIDDAVLGPTIVEVNAGRPGGQILGRLINLTTGVNPALELVALAAGAPPPSRPEPQLPMPLATLTVFGTGRGRLVRIHGLDKLAEIPEVLAVVPVVHPGDVLTDEYEMFAVNVLVGGFADRDDLLDVYAEAERLVDLELDPT
jgi:biotin carboxylase